MEHLLTDFIQDLFRGITLIKMVTAMFIVIGLSLIAEKVSTKFAGILSAFPLGAAITLFFIGYEIGPEFASESAVYTTVGLVSTTLFAHGYHLASNRIASTGKKRGILLSVLGGLIGYFASALLLRGIKFNLIGAMVFTLTVIVLFNQLQRNMVNTRIEGRVRIGPLTLFGRAFFAALVIILITAAAKVIGPEWSGLLSAFPVTMLPLFVVVHYSHKKEHVDTMIKNVPRGLVSILIYSAAVYLFYPGLGIVGGTLLAYLLATIYLVMVASDFHPLRWWRQAG